MSRLVMFPPMRPKPTMPILIPPPGSCSELVDCYAKHPPAVRLQALVIADGLRGDEGAEVVREPGNGNVGAGPARHQLHSDHAVGAALVQLSGGVQEPWAVPGRDGHTAIGVTQVPPQPLQRFV